MPKITINLGTKEIAIEGPEPFVDDYLDTIKEIMMASFKPHKQQKVSIRRRNERSVTPTKVVIPEITAIPAAKQVRRRRKIHPDTPSPDALQAIEPESPPVRRYILRKASTESTKEPIANVTQRGAGRVSIESMKENLGLTEQQIEGVLRDAEKEGRVRKTADGSYVWVS
jgi:hypothetical protein